MKRLLGVLFLLVFVAGIAFAQNSEERKGWGYPFFAVGRSSPGDTATLHFGGGGEGLVYKGLGLGAEIGYLSPARDLSAGIGIFSADGSYHFIRSGQKVVPFLTGGYSLAFRSGSANGGNFGGGVQIWMRKHVGLRLEFRDHYFSRGLGHLYGFRIAPAFR